MRIFKALLSTTTLPIGRFNFSNPKNYKNPTIVINIIKPAQVEVNHNNQQPFTCKKEDIKLDDLSRKELQQFLDFVV